MTEPSPILKRLYDRLGWEGEMGTAQQRPTLAALRREAVLTALDDCGGIKAHAAKRLGLDWQTVARIKRRSLAAAMILFCAVAVQAATFSSPPLDTPPSPLTFKMRAAVRVVSAPAAVAAPKTNGVITLAWYPDDQAASTTTITNLNTGVHYAVGAVTNITLGQQPVGTNSYVAATTLNGLVATSNVAIGPAVAETNRLAFAPYIFKADWPGAAGTLQTSSNLVLWYDVGPISSNASFLVTNTGTAGLFFRVKR